MDHQISWWAKGLLFENCNCQVVCPGHFHFSQLCTYERCLGHWGICFDEGQFGDVTLNGMKAIIIYDTPQHMVSGDWILTTYIDNGASPAQQQAIERIVSGEANGPWKVLAQFVKERKPTRRIPISFSDNGQEKKLAAGEIFRSTVSWLRGRNKEQEVRIENSFNQLHNATQVLDMGSTDYTDAPYQFHTKNTHALHSKFSWEASC